MMLGDGGKTSSYAGVMMIAALLSQALFLPDVFSGAKVHHRRGMTAGELRAGDRVIDRSWTWEHRGNDLYTGDGEVKHVTWIVAAADHEGYPADSITLVADEIIGWYPFDDSTNRGSEWGCNNWLESGLPNAGHGVRPFLNETFYNVFSAEFKAAVLDTTLMNANSSGDGYTTIDKVFIPSHTELGLTRHNVPGIGSKFAVVELEPDVFSGMYMTRSPVIPSKYQLVRVGFWNDEIAFASNSEGVLPVLNICSDTAAYPHPLLAGTYVLFQEFQLTAGELPDGSKVVDNSWVWEHRADENYSGSGAIKPVSWIIVGANHYDGVKDHVTLFSEEIVALHAFDNSVVRATHRGCNHWGNSGNPDATHGIRPFLNETFHNAFSQEFRNAVVPVNLPNKDYLGVDYVTEDKVFILSHTELGGVVYYFDFPGVVGSEFSYFQIDRDARRFSGTRYWTRSPDANHRGIAAYIHNMQPGSIKFRSTVDSGYMGVRPALNLAFDTPVSTTTNQNGAYELFSGAGPDSGQKLVYRFYSYGAPESTHTHLWTINEAERDALAVWPSWRYEGVAWRAPAEAEAGTVSLLRLYEPNIKRHLYTVSVLEYSTLENTSWNGEGAQYYVYPDNSTPGLLPVYRFYHAENQNHHFTIDENEKNTIIATPAWGYAYEGIAFYVF